MFMKIIYIICIIIIILVIYYINKPYKNEPYITVVANAGLCNKLNVLLSYLYKANKEGKKLKIIWTVYDQCPDKFNNLFKDIDNVIIEYYNDELMKESISDYNTTRKYNDDFISSNYFRLLRPIPIIQNEINNIKNLLNNTYIACHIRRTDSLNHSWYKNYIIHDDKFIKFINSYPSNLKIYIATDCKDTQQKFINIYGDRMVYKKIEDNNNLRQTSLQDAVKDIYVCADATYFKRSFGSFSDTIEELRKLKN